jgi:dienelactone hydrolase
MSYRFIASVYPPLTRLLSATLFILLTSLQGSALADWKAFNSAPVQSSDSATIRGFMSKPEGPGPFPAVIIAHGCFGVEQNQFDWAKRLNTWGYVTVIVDSFTTREVSEVCSDPDAVSADVRACDVFGAAAFLRKQAFVKPQRIGLIGFSHGGWTALYVAQEELPEKAQQEPLQAVVAYYPWCPTFGLKETKTPLLVLAGKKDDWTPLNRCERLLDNQKNEFKKQVKLIAYDNAYHGFDDANLGTPRVYDGHVISFESAAATKSIDDAKAYLARYLNP